MAVRGAFLRPRHIVYHNMGQEKNQATAPRDLLPYQLCLGDTFVHYLGNNEWGITPNHGCHKNLEM